VGRHHRRLSTPDRMHRKGPCSSTHRRTGYRTVQGRHCLLKEPRQEGHDFPRWRRPALHARRSEARSNFVSSVTRIITEYGFDGIDIDFESPSLSIDPGDTDFKHPTTPSIANLISALRQLRDRFGPRFMISLVPEGSRSPLATPAMAASSAPIWPSRTPSATSLLY